MKKIASATALTVAMISAPAFAQEAPRFGGPRVEATVGWDRVVLNVDGESAGKSGVTYGGEIGFDAALGGAIVGAYAGVDGSSTKECIVDGTESACAKAGRNFTVGARAGGLVGDRTLLYVKGGYSNGRVTAEYRDTAAPADNFSGSENMDGFHVGAGAQVGFSGGVYGKLEYNYTRYSSYEVLGSDVRLDRHRVVVGVGIGF